MRIPLTILAAILFLLFLPSPTHAATCNIYSASTGAPSGYGASYNVFKTSELMISIACNEDKSIKVTTGNNDPLTYIYKEGYYYNPTAKSWTNFTYSCDNMIVNSWCVGQVNKTLTDVPTDAHNFLVSYTCQWSGNKWNCGCSNSSCSTHSWQLQAWTVPTGGGGGTGEPVQCDDAPTIAYAPSGLPLMQSNPGAPIALFIDFDGGEYGISSSGSDRNYRGYNRNGSYSNFDKEEQDDIILSWTRMAEYYAMFDVNVTTDNAVRKATGKWGWILISEDASGGYAAFSSTAIGTTPYARSYVGASTARRGNRDKSRRIAHELGHNFKLEHSGVWDGSRFYKWEDWRDWDGKYGTIMGGGGEGDRNGWGYGHHEGDRNTLQDSMEVIRKRVVDVGGSMTGWREDDFSAQTPSPMCLGDGYVYRRAILGEPDDVDLFLLSWDGGNLDVEAFSVGVSTAVLDVEVLKDGTPISNTNNLEAGLYELRVRSSGGYAEIGAYEIRVR